METFRCPQCGHMTKTEARPDGQRACVVCWKLLPMQEGREALRLAVPLLLTCLYLTGVLMGLLTLCRATGAVLAKLPW